MALQTSQKVPSLAAMVVNRGSHGAGPAEQGFQGSQQRLPSLSSSQVRMVHQQTPDTGQITPAFPVRTSQMTGDPTSSRSAGTIAPGRSAHKLPVRALTSSSRTPARALAQGAASCCGHRWMGRRGRGEAAPDFCGETVVNVRNNGLGRLLVPGTGSAGFGTALRAGSSCQLW